MSLARKSTCLNYQIPNHVLKECPLLGNPLEKNHNQINAAFQCPRNDPYASTYNPEWTNHPNCSWNQGAYQGGSISNSNHLSGSKFSRANTC